MRASSPRVAAGAAATLVLAAFLLAGLAWPAAAQAHGILGRAYLPVPAWLFAWAAGIVLTISFVALGTMWSVPRLERPVSRTLFTLPRFVDPLCAAVGVGLFVLVVVAGLDGTQLPLYNLAPTAIFVLFWVGIPVLSAVLGDLFAAFSPWRALARGAAWAARESRLAERIGPPFSYPPWLGRWPAVAGIAGFAWVELVYVDRQHPATLAVLAVAYASVQLVGMAAYGIDTWCERGDGLAVAFNLYGRLAPLYRDGREVRARRPLSGLSQLAPMPGTVALLCVMIGTTTFDGALNGPIWRDVSKPGVKAFGHLGLHATPAIEVTYTLGLIFCVALCRGLYELGVRGMASASAGYRPRQLATAFIHSMVPIAFGYLLAHYFSLLVTEGQATLYLISDPLGNGSNWFGTASFHANYKFFSTTLIWYVQVAALVAGHVAGLASAHDRALTLYDDPEDASISQRWMLIVMVAFTSLGLWLLSAVYT